LSFFAVLLICRHHAFHLANLHLPNVEVRSRNKDIILLCQAYKPLVRLFRCICGLRKSSLV